MEIQAQDIINQVIAQRNAALDQLAQAAAQLVTLERKVEELEKEKELSKT